MILMLSYLTEVDETEEGDFFFRVLEPLRVVARQLDLETKFTQSLEYRVLAHFDVP